MQTTKHPDEKELEERHVAGYEREPAEPDEFDIPDGDHAWGDGPGSADWCNLAGDAAESG